jgi:hypothetical protein
MSERKKTHLEEEFDKHYSSKRGAWTNAWSPTWEDMGRHHSTGIVLFWEPVGRLLDG